MSHNAVDYFDSTTREFWRRHFDFEKWKQQNKEYQASLRSGNTSKRQEDKKP